MGRTVGKETLSGAPAKFAAGLHPAGEQVWAWLQPNGGTGEANAGLVVGDGAAAVIDTCWDQRQGRRLLDACEEHIAHAPVTAVVNTHSNGDHWWGNSLMPADAEIITSEASLAAMKAEKPAELALLRRLLGIGRHLPGGFGRGCAYGYSQLAPFAFEGVRLRLPETTFSGKHHLDVGGRLVELLEVGPAHTAGDTIAFVPDAGVVFTGDLLFVGQTPVMWDGPAAKWVEALDRVAALGANLLVPGHGPLATAADLAEMRAYWEWVATEVAAHHRRGLPPMDATLELLGAARAAAAPWASWDAPERTYISVASEYRRLDGQSSPLSPLGTLSTLQGVVRARGRLLDTGGRS